MQWHGNDSTPITVDVKVQVRLTFSLRSSFEIPKFEQIMCH